MKSRSRDGLAVKGLLNQITFKRKMSSYLRFIKVRQCVMYLRYRKHVPCFYQVLYEHPNHSCILIGSRL